MGSWACGGFLVNKNKGGKAAECRWMDPAAWSGGGRDGRAALWRFVVCGGGGRRRSKGKADKGKARRAKALMSREGEEGVSERPAPGVASFPSSFPCLPSTLHAPRCPPLLPYHPMPLPMPPLLLCDPCPPSISSWPLLGSRGCQTGPLPGTPARLCETTTSQRATGAAQEWRGDGEAQEHFGP